MCPALPGLGPSAEYCLQPSIEAFGQVLGPSAKYRDLQTCNGAFDPNFPLGL